MLPDGFGSECSEKLDRIYVCKECKAIFLFRADVELHVNASHHAKMDELPLE
jgi:hypothetical protein